MAFITEDVCSFLEGLDISRAFLMNDLGNLFDLRSTANSAEEVNVVVQTAIEKYEAVLSIVDLMNDEDHIQRYTGRAHLPHKVHMPKVFMLQAQTIGKLAALYGMESQVVVKEFDIYKKSILSVRPLEKQERSWHWERSFVLFFTQRFAHRALTQDLPDAVEQTALKEHQLRGDARRLQLVVDSLVDRFSFKRLQATYRKWQPSVEIAASIEAQGIPREAIYNPIFLGPFRNKCVEEGVSLLNVVPEYIKYLHMQRAKLENLISGTQQKT